MNEPAAPPAVAELGENGGLIYWCPGCREIHTVPTQHAKDTNPIRWQFNDDLIRPTLSPSVRHLENPGQRTACHYFVRDGRIEFCSDSAHGLAGQSVPLLPDPWNQS